MHNEGWLGLFKGIAPQISKGLIVQGLLMMTKERYVNSEKNLFLFSGLDDQQNGAPLYHSIQILEENQVQPASESYRACCIQSEASLTIGDEIEARSCFSYTNDLGIPTNILEPLDLL